MRNKAERDLNENFKKKQISGFRRSFCRKGEKSGKTYSEKTTAHSSDNKLIALVDCNSFYASCEKIFRPDLKNSPVIVLSNNDGCIVAASGEAKEAGIKRAQPLFEQKKTIREKKIEVFSSNYTLYADISRRIMEILKEICLSVEIYSIDEAFVTLPSRLNGREITEFALMIRKIIRQCTGVWVSVGIGKTKTLAKIANRAAKNKKVSSAYERIRKKTGDTAKILGTASYLEGVYILDSSNTDEVLKATAVEDIWMIGRQYAFMLHENSVHTAFDLKNTDSWWIRKEMTVKGYRTQCELRGCPSFAAEDMGAPRKGIVTSRQFGKPVTEMEELREAVAEYAAEAAEKLHRQDSSASSFTVFLETNRYREHEKQYKAAWTVKTPSPVDYIPSITSAAEKALSAIYKEGYRYRKTGIIITDICSNSKKQMELFSSENKASEKKLTEAVRELNLKYGKNTVSSLSAGNRKKDKTWYMRREMLSPCYTTKITDFPVVFAK